MAKGYVPAPRAGRDARVCGSAAGTERVKGGGDTATVFDVSPRTSLAGGTRKRPPEPAADRAIRRVIDVVTAVHTPAAGYLAEAYASLCAQELPDGWTWRWLIQEDGRGTAVAPHVPDDPRVAFHQGRAGGPGVARTLALAHATGAYVKVLDADDQLTPGALARDLAVLESDPALGWTTSRVLDLLPDGTTAGFELDPAGGPLERGVVLDHWRAHGWRAQVHPATLFVRRELLTALGGWMALPASEDTGLLLALNAVSRGCFIREYGLLYRKWPGQVTAQPTHTEAAERAARMTVIAARADALRRADRPYATIVR